jgi:hypothetical protein
MAKKRKTTRDQRTVVKLDILKEVDYIVGRAREGDARIVTLGSLAFFSTSSGDAWMLDAEDEFALCLARAGSPQPVHILETARTAAVHWDRKYSIDGEVFATVDQAGHIAAWHGYPTEQIRAAIRRAMTPPSD